MLARAIHPRAAASLRITVALVAALALLLLGTPSRAGAYPPTPPDEATSRSHLGTLAVAPSGSDSGYSRDKFPHWIDQGDNCNTREVVLKRDGAGVSVGSDCYPTSGSWYSVYDQTTTSDPSEVQIDHVVPLHNAWVSGASSWTTAQRQAFANDLSEPQLIAVSASSNESKSDRDPSEWKPPNTGEWCFYSRNWIEVKYRYHLTVTSAEKSALADMLDTC